MKGRLRKRWNLRAFIGLRKNGVPLSELMDEFGINTARRLESIYQSRHGERNGF
jgi:hypothetical protein